MFITLDGGDGCGKSTQQKELEHYLNSRGRSVLLCRDPGSTPLGDAVRSVLLQRSELQIEDLTEAFLFSAARRQLVREVIAPALLAGKTVISDRYILSTFVYQGYAGGVPVNLLKELTKIAVGNTLPDLGIVLDVPYEVALQRIGNRSVPDRMERKGEAYHRKVREGFLKLAEEEPERYKIVDASDTAEEVARSVREAVDAFMQI